jgi:hypothetical protein
VAFGNATFKGLGGAVNDIFGGFAKQKQADAMRLQAQGNLLEADSYDRAAAFSRLNKNFDLMNAEIKGTQQQRQIYLGFGQLTNDVESAGFQSGTGTAGDLLRSSQEQASLTSNAIAFQGVIEAHGHEVQAQSYNSMAAASRLASQAAEESADAMDIAAIGSFVSGGLSLFSAGFSLA